MINVGMYSVYFGVIDLGTIRLKHNHINFRNCESLRTHVAYGRSFSVDKAEKIILKT